MAGLYHRPFIELDIIVRIILLVLCLLTISCASAPSGDNPTSYDYFIDEAVINKKPIKKVILAPQQLGAPVLSHLRVGEKRVKAEVARYLKSNGFELMPDYHFKNAWNQAKRTYGDPYDPSTGRIDQETWRRVMITTGKTLRDQTDVDAIVFADVIEHTAQHGPTNKHYARWLGVTRKPNLVGSGNSIPADFDWSQEVKVASLKVTIYDHNLVNIFTSFAGIDVTQGIDMRSSTPSFIRRKKLLNSDNFIENSIEIGFHPFIVMDGYPGKSIELRRQEIAEQMAAQKASAVK